MRALWGKAPFQFDLREAPEPIPDSGDVLVRIGRCGICGTGLHSLRAMNRDWSPLGSELAGQVEKVGAGVSHLRAEPILLDINAFHFQKLQLRASHAIPNHYFPIALDLLARRVINPDRIITDVFPLNEYHGEFETANNPNERVCKVVVEP